MFKRLAFMVLVAAVVFLARALGVSAIGSALLGLIAAFLLYYLGRYVLPRMGYYWDYFQDSLKF